MSFLAQYPGTCARCNQRIKPGELIEHDGPEWSHVQCPEVRVPEVCGRCHMTKPCDCD